MIFLLIIIIPLLFILLYNNYRNFSMNKSNSFIKKTFYINLENSKFRRKKIEEHLSRNNIKAHRFNAVNGKKLENYSNEVKTYINKKGKWWDKAPLETQIGVALSHLKILEKVANDSNIDMNHNVMILEDDVKISNNFWKELEHMKHQIPSDFDMLLLGSNWGKGIHYSDDLLTDISGLGFHAYIVKKKFCIEMVNHFKNNKLNMAIDTYFKDRIYKNQKYKIFLSKKNIIVQNWNYKSTVSHRNMSHLKIDLYNKVIS